MPGFGLLSLRIAVVAGVVLIAGTSGPLAQDRVGINSAVNPDATGTPPGAAARKLVIGQEVVFNEHINTGEAGQTQLLFLDESSMTVGPNSDLTIDQFVYDPKSGTGKLAMSATRGLLRYVGGKLSKQDDAVTLRTSTATLAVRGGAFIANVGPNGTDAVFIYGKGLTVTGSTGGSETVTRPGFHSNTPPGGAPSPPGPTPPGQLTGFTATLDGRTGGTGGATTIPTDTNVANSGISQTISGNLTGSLQQSVQNQGGTQTTSLTTTTANTTQTTTTQTGSINGQGLTCAEQNNCPPDTPSVGTNGSGQPVGGSTPPAVTYTVSPSATSISESAGSLTVTITRSQSSTAATVTLSAMQTQGAPNNFVTLNSPTVSFAAGQSSAQVSVTINDLGLSSGTETFRLVVTDPNAFSGATTFMIVNNDITPPVTVTYAGRAKNTNGSGTARGFVDQTANGDIAYSSGTLSFPPGAPQNGVFTATIANNLGTISFPLVPGSASFQGTSSGLGAFTGTSFLSADNTFFYANITPTSQPAERLFIAGGTPVNSSFYQTTGAGLRPQAASNTRIFAFTVQPDTALQSNIPFVRSQSGGNLANASVSPLYIVAPPTTPIGDASTVSAARALQASLAINGQGSNQQSTIAVTTGTIASLQSSGQPILNGNLRGSSLQSASGTPVRLGSAISSTVDGNGNSFYGGNAISGFVVDQTAFSSGTNGNVGSPVTPSLASDFPLSGVGTTYGFAQPVLPAAVPAGVGANRGTSTLFSTNTGGNFGGAASGSFGGLMYTTAQPTPYIVTGGTFISTDVPNNRIQATLNGAAQSPAAGVTALAMQFGGLTGAPGAQAYVDDSTFAAAESQVNPQQITINGTASQPTGQLYLASSGAAGAPASLLPSGVSYCQCQYLQWGYWGGDLNSTVSGAARIDRGHINTWVAGVATSAGDLGTLANQSASGTYSGHAIGSVFNNGASYVAAGGFNGTYNFGTQIGTMAINNFDGHSFSATGKAPLNGANYNFGVTSPGATGTINGTFFGPMAKETGGSFAVQTTIGPKYLASGIFAGKQ
jgi:phosphatidylethanolamine-binding protein (PEBP) family uncharacterized protein